MLKKQLSLWLIAVFGLMFFASSLSAADSSGALTLEEVMTGCNAKAAEKFKTAKLVFETNGSDIGFGRVILLIGGEKGFRMDFVSAKEISTLCRNGGKFWAYDAKSGVFQPTDEEINEISYDLALCPFVNFRSGLYKPLTALGDGLLRNKRCQLYETVAADDKQCVGLQIWVDEATNLPQLIKMASTSGYFAVSYLDYREIDGIKVAARINSAGAGGVNSMRLVDVKFNAEFPDGIFEETDSGKNPQLLALQKRIEALTPAEKKAAPVKKAARKAAAVKPDSQKTPELNHAAIARVKKNIAIIDLRIAEDEKYIGQLKEIIKVDHKEAIKMASKVNVVYRPRRLHWGRSRYGWRSGYYGRARSKINRYRQGVARSIYNEGVEAASEYERLEAELTGLRIQRMDAVSQLERLQAGK